MKDVPRWSGVVILFSVIAVYFNDCQNCDRGNKESSLWNRLRKALDSSRIPLDSSKRVEGFIRWQVMWRQAYIHYLARKCEPWVIAKHIDDIRKNAIDSLSAPEVLRYLPELVRHFSLCVQAKSRGENKYEDALHVGWGTICAIAKRESWFSSINRRARYWIVYWAVQILRDAIDPEKHAIWFERLCTLCEEMKVNPRKCDPWYRTMLLKTITIVIRDHALFNIEQRVYLEDFIIEWYPESALDSTIKVELDMWLMCMDQFFKDELCVNAPCHSPLQIFAKIGHVLYRADKGEGPEDGWCECFKDLLTTQYEEEVLNAFNLMAGDLANRLRAQKPVGEVTSYFIFVTENNGLLQRLGDPKAGKSRYALQGLCLFAQVACRTPGNKLDYACELLVDACLKGLSVCDVNAESHIPSVYYDFIVAMIDDSNLFNDEFHQLKEKFEAAMAFQLRRDVECSFDTPEAAKKWLIEIAIAHKEVLVRCETVVRGLVFEKFSHIKDIYSDCWFEFLAKWWWLLLIRVSSAGWLPKMTDEQVLCVEREYLADGFDICSSVTYPSGDMFLFVVHFTQRALAVKEDFENRMARHRAKCQALCQEFANVLSECDRQTYIVPLMKICEQLDSVLNKGGRT